MRQPKPSAQSRTIDLFAGAIAAQEALSDKEAATVQEDAPEAPRVSENIEKAAERWRNNAFFTQEHLSKHFNEGLPGTAKFRLTEKDGWQFLEQFRLGKDGEAYHWTGIMFKDSDMYELTSVLVKAAKAKQAKNELPG